MTLWALILILVAAFIHATWNLLNKQASGHATFTWIVAVASAVLYAPLTIGMIVVWEIEIGFMQIGLMAGSAALHTAYFLLLNQGYRVGDLSLVYPLARGTGPLLSSLAAIVFLGERPSWLAMLGTALILAGVALLSFSGANFRAQGSRRAIMYALITGLFIAAYTLWDKHAVSRFALSPLALDWGANLGRAIMLTPFAIHFWPQTKIEWREHRYEAISIAALIPLSYILVLTAMQFTPVSYVAPAREISILIGTIMGTRLLAEGDATRRLTAAGAMVLGLIFLAIG
ncbi:MAG: EamA family transporter [Deltaproteobacteria bacterium]|nr:EamA family transporter [Deltaproteobacteria bacterium]